jgi:ABC-type branched-subunit amino acid transport system ATPase component
MAALLELTQLSKHFGGVRAVDALDLTVNEGEIFGLIGPNGSGKSTTVNLVCGVLPTTSGTITFRGGDITESPPHVCVGHGVARTFQNIRLFGHLSVWQNLWVAQNSLEDRRAEGFFRRWLSGSRRARENVDELLEFSGLAHRRDEIAGNLAFGEQRRLELARALAAKPELLLLDEPAAGMNLEEVGELDERLRTIRDQGKTILLVEHVMELVMGVTDRIAVLNFGQKIAEGTPAEIQDNPLVREAYLGSSAEGGGDA